MAIPNPNPNIADGYKSDNKTYSSNKIESLITMATELPVPAAGDAGKVLTVNADSDGYELDAVPNELPTPAAGDAGKVLTVNAGATGYELDAVPDELPTPTLADAGKVLTVNSTGTGYELDEISGGDGYTKTVLFQGDGIGSTTLNDSYKNYDALVFVMADIDPDTGDPKYIYTPYIPTDSDIGVHYKITFARYMEASDMRCEFTILSNTSINWLNETPVKKVIGINFGNGGSSSGLEVKKITWTGDGQNTRTITIPAGDVSKCTVLRICYEATATVQDYRGASSFDWGSTVVEYSNTVNRELATVSYPTTNSVTFTADGVNAGLNFNLSGISYTMYYTNWF